MNERKIALEVERNNISFSKPMDYFIYTRFSEKGSCLINSEQIRYSENISEAILYIRHIFLYDILNDLTDDIQYDFKKPFSQKQSDVISIMNFWFKFGKELQASEKQVLHLCEDFNNQFADKEYFQYEIHIIKGAEKLRKFLIMKYGSREVFDKYRLESICSKELFVGELLEEFTDKLFNT